MDINKALNDIMWNCIIPSWLGYQRLDNLEILCLILERSKSFVGKKYH